MGRASAGDDVAAGLPAFDLDGGMIWPVCADLHTHLDKGQTWFRVPNPSGRWQDALALVARDRETRWSAEDVAARMDFSLRCAFVYGTAAVRTHIDSMGAQGEISWPVVARMRDRWTGRIALQGVSLAMLDSYASEEASGLPISLPTMAASWEPLSSTIWIRVRRSIASSLWRLTATSISIFTPMRQTIPTPTHLKRLPKLPFASLGRDVSPPVTVAALLACRPPDAAERTIARVAAAGVAVVSLPMCNMYLQDRTEPGRTPRWRGVTLLHELSAAGVPVAVGSDNTRDPFYAYGDLDPIEVFAQAVRIAQLDSPLGGWARAITATPAGIMKTNVSGLLGQGRNADLILFRARSWSELLSRPSGPRLVIRGGRPVTDPLPDYRELDTLRR